MLFLYYGLLGASEVSANPIVVHIHLYWEGCVIICGYLWGARYFLIRHFMQTLGI